MSENKSHSRCFLVLFSVNLVVKDISESSWTVSSTLELPRQPKDTVCGPNHHGRYQIRLFSSTNGHTFIIVLIKNLLPMCPLYWRFHCIHTHSHSLTYTHCTHLSLTHTQTFSQIKHPLIDSYSVQHMGSPHTHSPVGLWSSRGTQNTAQCLTTIVHTQALLL